MHDEKTKKLLKRKDRMIRLLADRLAIALTVMSDCELDAIFDDNRDLETFWQRSRMDVTVVNEVATTRNQARWRNHSHFQQSMTAIRNMLDTAMNKQ